MRLKYGLIWLVPLIGSFALAAEPVADAPKPTDTPKLSEASAPVSSTPPAEVSIPFASMRGSIRDWRADDDKGIWIQSRGNQWYYATFFSPCYSLGFELSVGFMPGSTGTLDRWGALYTPSTGKCQFKSLVASGPPPPKAKRPPAEKTRPKN